MSMICLVTKVMKMNSNVFEIENGKALDVELKAEKVADDKRLTKAFQTEAAKRLEKIKSVEGGSWAEITGAVDLLKGGFL